MKNSPERLAVHPDAGQGERLKVPPLGVPGATPTAPDASRPRSVDGESGTLAQRELEYYLFVVESSLHVRKTHQFFVWAQGALQSLLPHEILFCVHGDFSRREYRVSCGSRLWSAPWAQTKNWCVLWTCREDSTTNR